MSQRTTNNDLDDWETDPDFISGMDEIDQRWGSKRTIGSINMNELIDEVNREHRILREKFQHPSQRQDYSQSKFSETFKGEEPTGGLDPTLERLSKHSVKEIKREVIRSSESSSFIEESNGSTSGPPLREIVPPINRPYSKPPSVQRSPIPQMAPKPNLVRPSSRFSDKLNADPSQQGRQDTIIVTDPPGQFREISNTRRIFQEEKESSLPELSAKPLNKTDASPVFKSIQEKIDAFKKEFDDIEQKLAKKSDISKVIKKTTNVEQRNDNVQYVSRSNEKINSSNLGDRVHSPPNRTRPTSSSPLHGDTGPKASIKSLSERFEMLGRESTDDFKRRMDERRKEFFNRIKTQVRETRKGLEGFDVEDSDDEGRARSTDEHTLPKGSVKQYPTRPLTSSPHQTQSTRSSHDPLGPNKPRIYTKRETTQEEVVSRIVKENDQIVHDETKRNVERTSSCHGSSDDETHEVQPTSIKLIDQNMRSSPEQRTQSPVDEIKRKVPVVEPDIKGAGLMARTLYDYSAAEHDELSFDVDELITNIEKIDRGWYKGAINRDGVRQVGLFPANYVKLLNDSGEY